MHFVNKPYNGAVTCEFTYLRRNYFNFSFNVKVKGYLAAIPKSFSQKFLFSTPFINF